MKNRLLTLLSRNWIAKIASLMFAISVFSVHRYQNYTVRTFVVPIDMQLIDNMSVVSQNYLSTTIKISGPKEEMINISRDDISVYADLSSFSKNGDYDVPIQLIKNDNLVRFSHITTEVKPDILSVKIDEKASKSVAVRPSFIGNLPDGYTIDSLELNPSEINIKGAKTRLDHLISISTKDISLSGQTNDFTVDVECKSLLQVELLDKSLVNVSVKLKTKEIEKELSGINVSYIGADQKFKVDLLVKRLNLKVRGNAKEFIDFDKNILTVEVDLSDIKMSGFYDLPLKIKGLPQGLSLLEPTTIEVNISEKQ